MSTKNQRVIIVGGGLAGLAGAVKCAELGVQVDLFSVVPVKRSHSVCAQGGINACNEIARQQGYSEYEHFDESIYGGDFLAHQPPVYEMAHWAPKIIDLLDRMGVPFNRTLEGQRDLRLFGGSLYKRTHFAGATTGQQLIYAFDEQARRFESEGKVTKYEHWEFLRPILDANGWAVNARAKMNVPFGGALTGVAALPPGATFGAAFDFLDHRRKLHKVHQHHAQHRHSREGHIGAHVRRFKPPFAVRSQIGAHDGTNQAARHDP